MIPPKYCYIAFRYGLVVYRLQSSSLTQGMQANQMFRKGSFFRFATGAGVFYCVAHTIARHVGELVICSGPSMLPTIHDGDLVLAERLSE